MAISWQAFGVIATYITLISVGLGVYVRLSIKAAHVDLFEKMNGRYVAASRCEDRHGATKEQLTQLQHSHNELHDSSALGLLGLGQRVNKLEKVVDPG